MREKSHAGGVTFSGASFLPAVCVLFRCVLDGERWVGGCVGRCSGKKGRAGGVTFLGVSFFPAVCVLFRCVLDGERWVGG